jgi:hypothetical protein
MTTTTTKYPDYDRAVSLAERISHELPTGWGTVTAVGTTGQCVIVGREFSLDDSQMPDEPTADELRSVWSIVRQFAVGGIEVRTHDAGADLLIGGAA